MDNDVFRAILAMDAYNHTQIKSISFRSEWNKIGTAVVITDSSKPITGFTAADNALSAQIGFGATAYRWTDSTGIVRPVISYRGTDVATSGVPYWNDIYNGWTVGAGDIGFVGPSQAALARQFFNAVFNPDPQVITDRANIELVGHSLGGGLAGFVASKLGGTVYAFDHMPFGIAAWAQAIGEALDSAATATGVTVADALAVLGRSVYDPSAIIGGVITAKQFVESFLSDLKDLAPDFGHIHAISTQGEILGQVRDGTLQEQAGTIFGIVAAILGYPVLGILLGAAGLLEGLTTQALESQIPDTLELPVFGAEIGSVAAHSMGLLTILEYAQKQWPVDSLRTSYGPDVWKFAAPDILPALQDEQVANALGLVQNVSGAWQAGAQLAGIIAYSAIDAGERPFGDTGIRALFDDASDLGASVLVQANSAALQRVRPELGKLAVEFAGWLAYQDVEASRKDKTSLNGVLTHSLATAKLAERLDVDLRAATWKKGGQTHTLSADTKNALTLDFIGTLDPGTLSLVYDWYKGVAGPKSLGLGLDVDRISIALSGGEATAQLKGSGVLLAALSDNGNRITSSSGRDLILGGKGNDIVFGGGGSDILIGGDGSDELRGGAGKDLLIAGTGDDILYGDAGADTFLFDPHAYASFAIFVGGKGKDVFDLRGSDGEALIRYYKGDGLDVFRSDADTFNFSGLKLTADGGIPIVPNHQFALDLPEYRKADVVVFWDAKVADTQYQDVFQTDLLVGRILVREKGSSKTLVDLGVYVGTHTYFITDGPKSYGSYDFGFAGQPFISFSDGRFENDDGGWAGLLVA